MAQLPTLTTLLHQLVAQIPWGHNVVLFLRTIAAPSGAEVWYSIDISDLYNGPVTLQRGALSNPRNQRHPRSSMECAGTASAPPVLSHPNTAFLPITHHVLRPLTDPLIR